MKRNCYENRGLTCSPRLMRKPYGEGFRLLRRRKTLPGLSKEVKHEENTFISYERAYINLNGNKTYRVGAYKTFYKTPKSSPAPRDSSPQPGALLRCGSKRDREAFWFPSFTFSLEDINKTVDVSTCLYVLSQH